MSDLVVVVAVTDREAKSAAHGISLFLVESGTKGFQKGRKLEKIGLKAQVTGARTLRESGGGITKKKGTGCIISLFSGHGGAVF